MWNLALPLLQSNLRHHVRKPLTLAAQALEDIDRYNTIQQCNPLSAHAAFRGNKNLHAKRGIQLIKHCSGYKNIPVIG